jgi:hypothetical protein
VDGKEAEAAGLALDWSCLPDPAMLDPGAPAHDSSSRLFALDRLHPMMREIGGKKPHVALNESLYVALDENGKPVATINEAVHRSVVSRYTGSAQQCANDDTGACSTGPYKPTNLVSGIIDPRNGL